MDGKNDGATPLADEAPQITSEPKAEAAPDVVAPKSTEATQTLAEFQAEQARLLKELADQKSAFNGEQAKAVAAMTKANQQLMTKVETLTTELAQAKQSALSPADLKQWQTYQKLGKPDNLQTVMAEYDQLKQQLAQTKRELVLKEAAELLDWKATVLAPILPTTVSLQIQDEKGKRAALVLGADGITTPLREYVEKNLADFLPALAKANPTNSIPRLDEGSKPVNRMSAVVEDFIANMNKAKVKSH